MKMKEIRRKSIDFMIDEVVADNGGIETSFKFDYLNDKAYIKLDDNFAKGNGYNNLHDMLDKQPQMKEQLLKDNSGKIPEWLLVAENKSSILEYQSNLN